jgi:hypothetical protein
MEDKDLYPCPWCRGEQVNTEDASERFRKETNYIFFVNCRSCNMMGPEQETADKARQVYNVVAKLVDDTMNYWFSVSQPHKPSVPTYALEFMQARREYAPY